ncbi:MAG: protein kinase [Acidobacteriota bacterium]|nr:protein kinase [Acidobacteriota bacterium]
MPLAPGTKLGPYEISSPLGAGGMGEVYRARDTRLDRDVALKVLPQHLSTSGQLRERFEREARAISSLKHPNICTLFDVGREGEVDYLVLEYLEGESLAQRLERGPLAVEQVLAYGIQMADALERAHRQGVVHRDLKPGNVMLTKDGLKLLDFGLAKPMAGAALAASAFGALTASHEYKPLTAEGTIVGTFQYMAPEQIEGKDADPRSDLFAFGCVLYEMTAGKRPFDGKTQASVVASILASDPPPLSTIQPLTPPALERVVKTCVAKDPDERWQTAHDVKLQLRWIAEGGSQAGVAAPVVAHRKHREWTAWGIAAVLLLLAIAGGLAYWRTASTQQPVVRSSILPPDKAGFSLTGIYGVPAISPDGTKIAFVAVKGTQRSIWLRTLSTGESKSLAGTEDGYGPFWSPDSRYLAFFANSKLQKVAAEGGPAESICDAEDARGGSWSNKGVIVFTPTRFSPLFSVPATGGKPTQVTELGTALSHRWPSFLPDGEHFLFVSSLSGSASSASNVLLGSIKSKTAKVAVASAYNAEYARGELFFIRDEKLVAQQFDPDRGELSGEPTVLSSDLQIDGLFSHALYSVSASGLLVFEPGTVTNEAQLIWYDRQGKQLGILGTPGRFIEVKIAPDENTVAIVEYRQSAIDLWLYDVQRKLDTRFTTSSANRYPLWSPDGSSLAFSSNRQTPRLNLFRQPVGGGAAEALYTSSTGDVIPTDWSRDGRFITFTISAGTTKGDIMVLPLEGERKPVPFMQTTFNERAAKFSPDGHWIAFDSDESGRNEVYVAPFPGGGRKWQVSTSGGRQALWRRSGTELYYLAPDNILTAVSIATSGSEPKIGTPAALFKTHPRNFDYSIYDVTKDGRFLVSSAPDESNAPLTLISNWPVLLKK